MKQNQGIWFSASRNDRTRLHLLTQIKQQGKVIQNPWLLCDPDQSLIVIGAGGLAIIRATRCCSRARQISPPVPNGHQACTQRAKCAVGEESGRCCCHIKLFPSLGSLLLISLVSRVFLFLRDVSIKVGCEAQLCYLNGGVNGYVSHYMSVFFLVFFCLFKLKTNPLKGIDENEHLAIRRHKHLPNEQFLNITPRYL